jgi:hypothetical protein
MQSPAQRIAKNGSRAARFFALGEKSKGRAGAVGGADRDAMI